MSADTSGLGCFFANLLFIGTASSSDTFTCFFGSGFGACGTCDSVSFATGLICPAREGSGIVFTELIATAVPAPVFVDPQTWRECSKLMLEIIKAPATAACSRHGLHKRPT